MAAGSKLQHRQEDLAAPEKRLCPRNDITNSQGSCNSTYQPSAASGLVNESGGPATWLPNLSKWCILDRLDFGPEAPVPQSGQGLRAFAGLATFVSQREWPSLVSAPSEVSRHCSSGAAASRRRPQTAAVPVSSPVGRMAQLWRCLLNAAAQLQEQRRQRRWQHRWLQMAAAGLPAAA